MTTWSAAAATAALVALVAACGGPSADEDRPESSASATRTPSGVTAETLVDALPDKSSFPKGSAVTGRCPGARCDADVEDDPTASISVNPALPSGAQRDTSSLDAAGAYRVAGGEWEETLKLRAWIYDDAATPRGFVRKFRATATAMNGAVDVAPVKTKTGYTYGSRGSSTVRDLEVDGWRGFVQVQSIRYVHLGGRATEPRYVVFAGVTRGKVFVRVDSSSTVQGRTRADAVKTATDLMTRYLSRVGG